MKPPIDGFSLLSYNQGPVTQYFGENERLYRLYDMKGHNGIDLVRPHGSALYAVEDSEVVDVKFDAGGFGRHVRLIAGDNEWTYGHCHTISVKVGQKVKAGEQIATMGNTGFVVSGATPFWKHNPYAGTHLHLGLRKIKRSRRGWSYPQSTLKFEVLDYGNGYKGSIDPAPLLGRIGYKEPESTKRQQMLTTISLLNTVIRLLKSR
jgi:murein DD-endopeptidase MepM/ murein hydrolase activator NlpD